jgi:hypothetical protein
MVVHNVACIYAVLARDAGNARPYQDQTIDLLRRSLDICRERGDVRNEIGYIQIEPEFDAALRARPEFEELITPKPAAP